MNMSDKCILCGKEIKTRYMLSKLTPQPVEVSGYTWSISISTTNSMLCYTAKPYHATAVDEAIVLPICEECLKKRLGDVIVVETL